MICMKKVSYFFAVDGLCRSDMNINNHASETVSLIIMFSSYLVYSQEEFHKIERVGWNVSIDSF